MLELRDVYTAYGHVNVLNGVTVSVNKKEAVTIIGANGAGKSTLLKTVSGLIPVKQGSILFNGQEISKMGADKRVGEGIIQVPEGRMIFAPLSVEENLELGMYQSSKKGLSKEQIEVLFATVYRLFPILKERKNQRGDTLSGGEQQMLAIGRGLMGRPNILLLDEPSLGLAPLLVEQIFLTLRKLRDEGLTIVLVEQNAQIAMEFAERGYVMELGKIVLEDSTPKLKTNEKVRQVYLGVS
jgi:branched-chain amino acid transport system ATP-binding protein